MTIATKRGDGGQTGLAGGIRVSKSNLRVEAYGTVDELNTCLGLARSLCTNPEIAAWTQDIQRTLFRLGSALATPPESKKLPPTISQEDVDKLTALVERLEAIEGIPADRFIAGAHTESAAYQLARTVCRRAERNAVRFLDSGATIQPTILPYLNRLSDLLGLFARLIEFNAENGESKAPPRWSRAS